MRMVITLVKNHLPNSSCKRYTLRINSELQAEILRYGLYYASGNLLLSDPGTSMRIYIRRNWVMSSLRITTALEPSLVVEALANILSAMAATRRISLNTESLLRSIVAVW